VADSQQGEDCVLRASAGRAMPSSSYMSLIIMLIISSPMTSPFDLRNESGSPRPSNSDSRSLLPTNAEAPYDSNASIRLHLSQRKVYIVPESIGYPSTFTRVQATDSNHNTISSAARAALRTAARFERFIVAC
jgi:hypothetical protein